MKSAVALALAFAIALGLSGLILLGGIAAYLLLIHSRIEIEGV